MASYLLCCSGLPLGLLAEDLSPPQSAYHGSGVVLTPSQLEDSSSLQVRNAVDRVIANGSFQVFAASSIRTHVSRLLR